MEPAGRRPSLARDSPRPEVSGPRTADSAIKPEVKAENSTPPPEIIDLATPSPTVTPPRESQQFAPNVQAPEDPPTNSGVRSKRAQKFALLTDDPDYYSVVFDPSIGQYVELRCPDCKLDEGGGNSGLFSGKLILFRGATGFRCHMKTSHMSKYPLGKPLSNEDAVSLCTTKVLSEEEVEAVRARDKTVFSVPKILVPKAEAGSFVHVKRAHKSIPTAERSMHSKDDLEDAQANTPDADHGDVPVSATEVQHDVVLPSGTSQRTLTMETRNRGVARQNHVAAPRKSPISKTRQGGKKRSWNKQMNADEVLFSDDDEHEQEVTAMQEIQQPPLSIDDHLKSGYENHSTFVRGASSTSERGKRARMADDIPSGL